MIADCDFGIESGIYLVQPPHKLDLQSDFDFCGLDYSIENRTLTLRWRRTTGDGAAGNTPASIRLEFREVTEFRFMPRDAELPFSEDTCVHAFGYWTDELWTKGQVFTAVRPETGLPDPDWLTAISFMSGAIIAIQAASAHARIEP